MMCAVLQGAGEHKVMAEALNVVKFFLPYMERCNSTNRSLVLSHLKSC